MTRIFFLLIAFSIFSNRITAQDTYRVKADKVNVRASNNAKSKVVATVNQNENVTVIDANDSKLYKVKLKNGEGWISKDFLEKVATSTPSAASPQSTTTQTNSSNSTTDVIYRVTTDNLRVRQKADP
ncbi:MAG: SH3 domain-containing protein, partial [Pedobacter sp.]